MDQKTIASIQQILTVLATLGVTLGYVTSNQADALVNGIIMGLSGIMGAGSVIWAIWQAHRSKKVAVAADAAGVPVDQVNKSPLKAAADIGANSTAVKQASAPVAQS